MKVPEARKLKSGSWFIQLRLGGESISVTAPTEKECRRQAQHIKAEYLAGKRESTAAIKKAGSITLQQAFDNYIEKHKAVLSPSTHRVYQIYSQKRFPEYRHRKLSDIDWQEMINDELLLVSEKTVKNAWGLVTPSLKFAGYPVPEVKLTSVPVNEIPFLQPEEIVPFCDALKGRSYEIPALLELHGLRLSEVRGLDWKNVNLKTGMITVHGALVRGADGEVEKQTNKNRTSSRPVPIMIPQLKDALEAVEDKNGKVAPICGTSLLDDVRRTCKRAGVTEVTNHGLRHSFASLCYYLEIPERQIQEWGGWKDRYTLHKIYIRLAASMQTSSADRFAQFFSNKKSPAEGEEKKENANENANEISNP